MVTGMKYRLSFYDGQWTPPLTLDAVEELLSDLADEGEWTLVEYEMVSPDEDMSVVLELTIVSEWSDTEHVRDKLIETVLVYFDPEFESMIEVEVIDDRGSRTDYCPVD